MRIVIRKKVDRDFMGGKTTVTKIVIDEADGSSLQRLLGDPAQDASRRLGAPVDTDAIDVTSTMQEAARKVFLSPSRVEALRETLAKVYREMERVRRGSC